MTAADREALVRRLLHIVDRAEYGSMLASEAVQLRAGIRALGAGLAAAGDPVRPQEAREGPCTPLCEPGGVPAGSASPGGESASEAHSRTDPKNVTERNQMPTYETRVIVSTRREWIVPAADPWGAAAAEVAKAWRAAEIDFRQAHNIPEDQPLHDDALRFHTTDDAIVITFTTEEPK